MTINFFKQTLCGALSAALLICCTPSFAGNIDPDNDGSKYAWGENIGWINFKPTQGSGVTVADEEVTGFAWEENIGWINMSPSNGGVFNDGIGNLFGHAWAENAGWIDFSPSGAGVFIDACGDFNGLAWGENIGWINFRSDGVIPFYLRTSWVSPIDEIPPVTDLYPELQEWYNTAMAITLSATDCGAGVKEVRYSINGEDEIITSGSTVSLSFSDEGWYEITYYSVDNWLEANMESPKVASFCIDRTPPNITIEIPSQGASYYLNTSVNPVYHVSDVGCSGILSSSATPMNTTALGTHDFTVSATDNAGNTSTITVSYTVIFRGNIDPANNGSQYAWGENVGWINLKPSWGPGVSVSDSRVSGFAWGGNVGWIDLSPPNGGVLNDGAGNLSGFAWGENVGWIDFAPQRNGVSIRKVKINATTGVFSGYAWGENVGWINFGFPGREIVTSWRPANLPPVAFDQELETDQDTPIAITLTGFDPENSTLSFLIVDEPKNGWLSGTAPDLVYHPDTGYNGLDCFSFKVNDGINDSDVAIVTITVNPVAPAVYTFFGFFAPIDNAPIVNTAKAGQAIPVKWRITDNNGAPISDPESFESITSYAITCDTLSGSPTSGVEEYAGSSGLQYLGEGNWQFNWKTQKSYAGKCRVMTLSLGDGSTHKANFHFK